VVVVVVVVVVVGGGEKLAKWLLVAWGVFSMKQVSTDQAGVS